MFRKRSRAVPGLEQTPAPPTPPTPEPTAITPQPTIDARYEPPTGPPTPSPTGPPTPSPTAHPTGFEVCDASGECVIYGDPHIITFDAHHKLQMQHPSEDDFFMRVHE